MAEAYTDTEKPFAAVALRNPLSGRRLKFSNYSVRGTNCVFVPEILPGEFVKRELFKDTITGEEFLAVETVNNKQRLISRPPPFAYGFITQTLSDPAVEDPILGFPGDGDCLDAFLVGEPVPRVGTPINCIPVAAWAAVDAGESDWKLLLVRAEDDPELVRSEDIHACELWLKSYKQGGLDIRGIVTIPKLIYQVLDNARVSFFTKTAPAQQTIA